MFSNYWKVTAKKVLNLCCCRAHLTCVSVFHSNLLSNPYVCDCHLAWLGQWLKKTRVVSGNPRCQKPAFLKEIPIQDVATPDFTCDGDPHAAVIQQNVAISPTKNTTKQYKYPGLFAGFKKKKKKFTVNYNFFFGMHNIIYDVIIHI